MTTGNDRYAEHLRGQLTAVLDDVTPSPAPTAVVKRRGRAMKVRRRVGVAVGLGIAVVAATLVPGLLRQSAATNPVTKQHKNPKVTVGYVGRDAKRGVIAEGAINGKKWRITLSWQGKDLCVGASGDLPEAGCGTSDTYAANWPATLDGSGGGGGGNVLYGIVASQVRLISLDLSDGDVVDLRPVKFFRYKWIGVVLPAKLAVTRVVAYSRDRELAYAIPYTAAPGGLPSVENWLRPGEPTPRVFVRVIGSGVSAGKRWSVTVHAGPWGQCALAAIPGDAGGPDCWSADFAGTTGRTGFIVGTGGAAKPPWWAIGAASARVSYLVLSMTDGTTRRIPVVQVGRDRLYSVVMLSGPRIARWAAYDASGNRLDGGPGAPVG